MIGTGRFVEDFKIAKEHDIRVTDLSPGAFWKVLVQKSIDDGNRSKKCLEAFIQRRTILSS